MSDSEHAKSDTDNIVTGKKRVRPDPPPRSPLEKANGDDPVANGLGLLRSAEEDPELKSKVSNIEVRVDALLNARLKSLACTVGELKAWREKVRGVFKRLDETCARHEDLLKRHEAICKTSYWAVQRLREQGVLPESRSASSVILASAAATTAAYAEAQGNY